MTRVQVEAQKYEKAANKLIDEVEDLGLEIEAAVEALCTATCDADHRLFGFCKEHGI
jgi:hypothetical protein